MLDPQQRKGKSIVRQTRQEERKRETPPSEGDRAVGAGHNIWRGETGGKPGNHSFSSSPSFQVEEET